MDPKLEEAITLYKDLRGELDKCLIGLDDVKEKTAIAFFSEIPTTLAAEKRKRVNAGLVWLVGVPGVGKTYFGIVFAAVTETTFGRIQGRADLIPGDVVGVEVFSPKTGEFEVRLGPINVNILLIDEGNRIPPKSQSAFLEANQERKITIGKQTFDLPEFYFAMMTTNPVETSEGTYPLSAANSDRFTLLIDVGYLPPDEEQKLVNFDIKKVHIKPLVKPEKVIELRSMIGEKVHLGPKIAKYIRRLVVASRPNTSDIPLVREFVELGASPRATINWGPVAKVRALFVREDDVVFPEDVQALASNILRHRLHLVSRARAASVTTETIIKEIVRRVPIP